MSETRVDLTGLAGRFVTGSVTSAAFVDLDDASLLEAVEALTALRHDVERCQAIAAAEVARRSSVSFGGRGLAQRAGHTSSGALLQSITRASRRDATAMVSVGQMIAVSDADTALDEARSADPSVAAMTPAPTRAWFSALGTAVAGGVIPVSVADAIRGGLGEPTGNDELLATELPALIEECRALHADAARRIARQTRDRIDRAGVAERADRQHLAEFWRVWLKPDGMVRGEFELEPEAGMLVKAVFDQLTHPRHIEPGVRRGFSDPEGGDRAFAGAKAARERAAAEGLVQLLRAGASVDPARLLNEKKPSVRIVVNADALSFGDGTGAIEGHPDRIPLGIARTGICEGYLPVRFGEQGECLDLGRDERLFTDKQKAALAIRDGGCMDPDCTRPPSWTEAHHIDHWQRDNGRTDLADGILLCRRDHLRYHNQGWEVRRDGAKYWLIPPSGVDPEQRPRLMRSKTPADIINPVDPRRLPAPAPSRPPEPERRGELLRAVG